MPVRNDVRVEFDEASGDYYAVWRPIVIGSGSSRHGALEDLRRSAHLGVDTFIDQEAGDTGADSAVRRPGWGARPGGFHHHHHWHPFRHLACVGSRMNPIWHV